MSAALLKTLLEDPKTTWSIGVFGALAEFHREAGERADVRELHVATALGAIRLTPDADCTPVPFAPRSEKQKDRVFGTALCLPAGKAALQRRDVITELGEDREAIREEDRGAILFDLGLGSPYVNFCVRTSDPLQIDALRRAVGTPLLEPGNPLFDELAGRSPHRVCISRLGRIEVYQRIAERGGKTPPGPHTHLLPRLVRSGRTHSANAVLPAGLIPCATFYPVTA